MANALMDHLGREDMQLIETCRDAVIISADGPAQGACGARSQSAKNAFFLTPFFMAATKEFCRQEIKTTEQH